MVTYSRYYCWKLGIPIHPCARWRIPKRAQYCRVWVFVRREEGSAVFVVYHYYFDVSTYLLNYSSDPVKIR